MLEEERNASTRSLVKSLYIDCAGGKTSSYSFELNLRCNAQCIFCSRDAHVFRASENLEISEIKNLLKGKKAVSFLGGEPLTDPRLPYLLEYCRDQDIKTSIISNGTLLADKKLCDAILKPLNLLILSIPSVNPDIYNYMMGFDGFPLLQKAIHNIASSPYWVVVDLDILTLKSNLSGISKVPEYLINNGVPYVDIISLLAPVYLGRLEDHPLELPNPADPVLLQEIEKIRSLAKDRNIVLRGENCSACMYGGLPFALVDSEYPLSPTGCEYLVAKKINNELILYSKADIISSLNFKQTEVCSRCSRKERCSGLPETTRILFSNDIKPL